MRRRLTAVALAGVLALLPASASAQQWLLGGSAQLGSGIQAGGGGALQLERARTTLRLGADARVDEFPKDRFGVALVVELEPHTSLGFDVKYMRQVGAIDLSIGGVGFIYPQSLVGPACGADYHLHLSKTMDLLVGPRIDVFAIGSDLPSGSVVWQVLLQVGIHVDL